MGVTYMFNQTEVIEPIIGLLNKHFQMDIELGQENLPRILQAENRSDGSLTEFINELIRVIEDSETDGRINYYFGDELNYDTPEEFHRY
jgi:predicted DNA-binding ArsR family transcriptional regulator